tara:strand:+ start:2563 stop:2931 length:369 start_codon:yes stop_codon:yes gene_type:complete
MNILVTRSNGQLGSEIKDLVTNYKDLNFFFRDLPELNICNPDSLDTFILDQKINAVVNNAAIMKFGSLDCIVRPIETKDYPTLAKSPYYSILNKSKIKLDFNMQIPFWRDSLNKCIEKLKSN